MLLRTARTRLAQGPQLLGGMVSEGSVVFEAVEDLIGDAERSVSPAAMPYKAGASCSCQRLSRCCWSLRRHGSKRGALEDPFLAQLEALLDVMRAPDRRRLAL